jgi:predicted amidohydrolase YtcJ
VHAVGDGAIAEVLDALQDTGGERWRPLRPRIEHGDMLQAADLPRLKGLGIVVVQNPSHFMIAPLLAARFGSGRAAGTEQVKTITEGGVRLAFGSDGPMNPYLNMMFAALNPASPAQALSIEQSLRAYTAGSAFAELEESKKGVIAPGMLADLAVLSQDIFRVPVQDLPATASVLTVVGGRIVHSQ